MTILVTGSTGNIGRQVVAGLSRNGAQVRALVRTPSKADFPKGVEVAKGDLLDIEAMRAALSGVSTLFLLNAVTPDEVTQALITLNLAREAGVRGIVYFSVIHADLYANVPHFTGKHTVERMIEKADLPATVLRPAYFMDNDVALKAALTEHGVYAMPLGAVGLSVVDSRDIADIAVAELLRRERAAAPLPRQTITVVGPDCLTGSALAAIWTDVLGRPVRYGGDDPAPFEKMLRSFGPAWLAYDARLMAERFQRDGMVASKAQVALLEQMLGRPLRTYRQFATELAAAWARR